MLANGTKAPELDLPDQFAAWKDLSATGETCLGKECKLYEDCFVTRARMKAAAADLVLVNHHLFFADLALRLRLGAARAGDDEGRWRHGDVVPPAGAAVFDEAHGIEETASLFFGVSVSLGRARELARDVKRSAGRAGGARRCRWWC